jgi:hypothetical protein
MIVRAIDFARRCLRSTFIAALITSCCWTIAARQQTEDSTRGLWDKAFKEARAKVRKKTRRADPDKTKTTYDLIGITIWQVREPSSSDSRNRPRLLRHKNSAEHLVAERVDFDTPFSEGWMIRLGIEVPRDGFLYVIDREVYSDGTLGDAYLIFPTRHTRGGNNRVSAGRVIEIPAQTDDPPYFTLERSRRDQVSERLTIIVSPAPLDLPLASDRVRLDSAQLARWERLWGGETQRRDSRNGKGQIWTLAEKESAEGKRILNETDPLPQTIFHIASRRDTPLLVNVPIRIAP